MKRLISSILCLSMFFTLVFTGTIYAQDTTISVKDVLTSEIGVQIRDNGTAPEVDPAQIVIDTRAGGNRRQAFVKFDFSKYADKLDDITKIDFLYEFEQSVLPAVSGGTASWQNFSVYLIPKNLKDLWSPQMKYAEAQEAGLLSNDYVIHSGYLYYSLSSWTSAQFEPAVDFTDAILNYLKNSNGDMEVLLRFDSTASDLVAILRGFGDVSSPRMTISYNKSVNEILQEAYDDFTFDKISDELANDVHNDLNLFTRYKYGTTITWTADDPCIDLTSGNYTGSVNWTEDKDVTLTATFENSGLTKTREYKISVRKPYDLSEGWFTGNSNKNYYNYYRNGVHAPYNYSTTNASQLQIAARDGSDWRVSFVEFNLFPWLTSEKSLEEVYCTLYTSSPVGGGYATVSVLPQELEDVWTSGLSHREAEKAGLIAYNKIDTSDYIPSQGSTYIGSNIASAINQHLRENPGDGRIVLKIESNISSATVLEKVALCVRWATNLVKPIPDLSLASVNYKIDGEPAQAAKAGKLSIAPVIANDGHKNDLKIIVAVYSSNDDQVKELVSVNVYKHRTVAGETTYAPAEFDVTTLEAGQTVKTMLWYDSNKNRPVGASVPLE
ncbi:MAG: hypothetical protein IJB70_03010 [Clostridia bacterium]|nr:hypothetical protein [Clostridia bacterium]